MCFTEINEEIEWTLDIYAVRKAENQQGSVILHNHLLCCIFNIVPLDGRTNVTKMMSIFSLNPQHIPFVHLKFVFFGSFG